MFGLIGAIISIGWIHLNVILNNDVKFEIRSNCQICEVKKCVECEGADAIRVSSAQRSPVVE